MHIEILKHELHDDGEINILETAEMAVCLGVVQNYTMSKVSDEQWCRPWRSGERSLEGPLRCKGTRGHDGSKCEPSPVAVMTNCKAQPPMMALAAYLEAGLAHLAVMA